MSDVHPFERLKQSQVSMSAAFYERQYELSVLRMLLTGLRLPVGAVIKRLQERDMDDGGDGDPTLRGFCEEFPTFPALLGSSRLGGIKLHLDPKSMIPSLYNKFDRTPFARAYTDFFESNERRCQGRVRGLVFVRHGVRQGLIIHDEGIDPHRFRGTCITHMGANPPKMVFIRPFQTFVETIYDRGHGWRPDS